MSYLFAVIWRLVLTFWFPWFFLFLYGPYYTDDVWIYIYILMYHMYNITRVHSNQDLIWCVKIGVYMGFWAHCRSWLLWPSVIAVVDEYAIIRPDAKCDNNDIHPGRVSAICDLNMIVVRTPFGLSVGIFCALGTVLYDVYHVCRSRYLWSTVCLNDRHGSSD